MELNAVQRKNRQAAEGGTARKVDVGGEVEVGLEAV